MARTFLIDPAKVRPQPGPLASRFIDLTFLSADQSQEKNYTHLLELQKYVLGLMKDGAIVKDVCTKAASFVKENRPEAEEYLSKTFGMRVSQILCEHASRL